MSAHTPGPWRITNRYPMALGYAVALQRGREIEHEEKTGEVFGLYLGREGDLPMADLRLIAAAPELLEVLSDVKAYLDMTLAPCLPGCDCLCHAVDAVLAKAEAK